jgi:hypothetical protein
MIGVLLDFLDNSIKVIESLSRWLLLVHMSIMKFRLFNEANHEPKLFFTLEIVKCVCLVVVKSELGGLCSYRHLK